MSLLLAPQTVLCNIQLLSDPTPQLQCMCHLQSQPDHVKAQQLMAGHVVAANEADLQQQQQGEGQWGTACQHGRQHGMGNSNRCSKPQSEPILSSLVTHTTSHVTQFQ